MTEQTPELYAARANPASGVFLLRADEQPDWLSEDEARSLAFELLEAAGQTPVVYLTAADIAAHFGVDRSAVHSWRARYGPDRTADEIARVPSTPAPETGVQFGLKKPPDVWRQDRLPEWDAWRASLPGHGVRGGRPSKSEA